MVQIQVRPPVLNTGNSLEKVYSDDPGLVTLRSQEGKSAADKRAADDLTIEENVLKKILQEKKIMSDARNCVERKQLMLRDKKTLY